MNDLRNFVLPPMQAWIDAMRPHKIWLTGHAGCGKTTTALVLAQPYGLPVIHLDDHVFEAGWVRRPAHEIRSRVLPLLEQPRFIVEGANLVLGHELAAIADEVLWIDPPLPTLVLRLLGRSVRRCWTKEHVTNNNHECWRDLLSPRALWFKALRTYNVYRERVFACIATRPFTRICSNQEFTLWLRARGIPTVTNFPRQP